ncbi:MAG: TetR/AcrR family transcriptional regulator [Desulfamplus sp.]|nr:TetR/AcrR family transcriptional regulator [Desulfamplus sp.]
MTKIDRKNQAQRSAETQIKLFEATLDSLQEFGYRGTSLSKIMLKAGVSKGAWSHHFTSKSELVVAASEYILNKAIETTQDWVLSLNSSNLKLFDIFDFIWNNFYIGRHRDIWLELNIACRTDGNLKDRLSPIIAHFHKSINKAWKSYTTAKGYNDKVSEHIMILTINCFRGMAIQSITQNDHEYFKELRMEWFKIVSILLS